MMLEPASNGGDELCYESLSGNRDEAEIISCDEIGEARAMQG